MSNMHFQSMTKYVSTNDFKALNEIAEFAASIYQKNSNKTHKKYYDICGVYARMSRIAVKCSVAWYTIFMTSYGGLCIVDSLLGEFIRPPLRFYLPGMKEESFYGTIFLIVFESMVLLLFIFGTCLFDSLLYVVFINVRMVSKIIIEHVGDFENELRKPQVDISYIKQKHVDIFRMQMKYNE